MRWIGSWAFYWVGHVAYLLGDQVGLWPGHFWYSLYQHFMGRSSKVQGDGKNGPWSEVVYGWDLAGGDTDCVGVRVK